MILGLDFAQTYRIGIDWDETMAPYLRTAGKFLVKAMPLKSLSSSNLVQEVHLKEETNLKKDTNKLKNKRVYLGNAKIPKPLRLEI